MRINVFDRWFSRWDLFFDQLFFFNLSDFRRRQRFVPDLDIGLKHLRGE
ncbi:MAG TPA: hypothetical protein QF901_09180 [Gammaproteobacteria bacterium]|nr:hypothetical protein [Gammaproteobacteria bacterium]